MDGKALFFNLIVLYRQPTKQPINNEIRDASLSISIFFSQGFYQTDPNKRTELVVGPYQGGLACLRIPFSKGVCGAAAREQCTQQVDDVHQFPGHIACASR